MQGKQQLITTQGDLWEVSSDHMAGGARGTVGKSGCKAGKKINIFLKGYIIFNSESNWTLRRLVSDTAM